MSDAIPLTHSSSAGVPSADRDSVVATPTQHHRSTHDRRHP